MYALFPNEARTYLSKHRVSEKVDFMLEQESSATKEDDYVDINQIRELVRVAEESGVGEIVVEEEGMRIAVRMPGPGARRPLPCPPLRRPRRLPLPPCPRRPPRSRRAIVRPRGKPVVAPMVGTYYEAPAPGEPPFVKVGDEVAAGETLCIVEAMKLMNEITAEEMGTVREVCLSDATPVEYGTVLFYVEPHEPHAGRVGDKHVRENSQLPTAARWRCASCAPARELGVKTVAVYSTEDADTYPGALRRRGRLHRPCPVEQELSGHGLHHRRGEEHRRRGDPPRLRLPGRERGLRPRLRRQRPRVHRPRARVHRAHGRQVVAPARP